MSVELVKAFIPRLQGAWNTRCLILVASSIILYDYFLTLDGEIQYFWTGAWTISRVLFFINRYLTLVTMITVLFFAWAPDLTPQVYVRVISAITQQLTVLYSCHIGVSATIWIIVVALLVAQVILIIRIFYLFPHSWAVKSTVAICFVISTVVTTILNHAFIREIVNNPPTPLMMMFAHSWGGCAAALPPPVHTWTIYLPSLVLHTILYIFTAIPALRNRHLWKESPVVQRLVQDGGFFLIVVLVSIGLTSIGAFLVQYPQVNLPASYSNFALGVISISISRLMFSIHSLADKLGVTPGWLLNSVELSRVQWREGKHEGEIIVESSWGDEGDSQRECVPVKISCAGVYEKCPDIGYLRLSCPA